MTQRSGKFTRGSAVFEELRAVHDGDGYVLTEGNRVEICHHGGAQSLGLPRDEVLANANLIVAAFNAATTAEDMGYDGQAAVEALPELLRALWRVGHEPIGHPEASHSEVLTQATDIAREVLAACCAKEPGK